MHITSTKHLEDGEKTIVCEYKSSERFSNETLGLFKLVRAVVQDILSAVTFASNIKYAKTKYGFHMDQIEEKPIKNSNIAKEYTYSLYTNKGIITKEICKVKIKAYPLSSPDRYKARRNNVDVLDFKFYIQFKRNFTSLPKENIKNIYDNMPTH